MHLKPGWGTDNKNYPGSNIFDVVPSRELGGMLNFDGEHAQKLIRLGYEDAQKQLKNVL